MEDFLDNCTDAEKKEVTELADDFLYLYQQFSTGYQYYNWYNQLLSICVPHSDIVLRMSSALEGYVYTKARTAEMTDENIYRIFRIADGVYLCDVTYTLTTYDTIDSEPLVTDFDVRLIMNRAAKLQVSALLSN